MQQSQINVVFAGIDSKLFEADTTRWVDAKHLVEVSGGKFWYVGQEHDNAAKRNEQYLTLEDHLVNDTDKYSCWVFVEHSTSTASPELKYMALGVKQLIFQHREGFASFADVAREDHLDFFFKAIDTSTYITLAKATSLMINDHPIQ